MADNTVLLSKDQVSQVLQFARGIYAADRYGYGAYSPFMSNQLLNDLNNNAETPTSDKIKKALADYKNNADNLQNYVEFMSHYDMLFKRTLLSYVNALSYDLMIYCDNAYTQADYESAEYTEDKRKFYKFLEKFNYKAEFRNVTEQVVTNEVFYTWFRKTKWKNKGMKCALQILPQRHCMLTGYWDDNYGKGMLFDFDMSYFLNPGVDIDGFDPKFKEYYNCVFTTSPNGLNYRPSADLNERTGEYAMWTQTSPEDGAWVFKLNMSNFNTTPLLAPFLKDAIKDDEVATLQYDKDMASAYGLLVGELRLFDDAKSGTKANQFAIDPKTLGEFMGMVKRGLGNAARAVAMPTENTKYYQFNDQNENMYSDQLKNTAGVGSSISRVIYSSDRMSNAEIEAGLNEVYNIVRPLYRQFEHFLNFYGNKTTKKYRFRVVMDGSNYRHERQQRMDDLMKLADKGMVLSSSAYASAIGMTPMAFDHMIEEAKWGDFSQKWQMLINTNTSSFGSADNNGRPRLDDSSLTASGEASRDGLD